MIKRLKWNVLYGEAVEDDSDSSDSSEDSVEGDSVKVQAVLDQLARNDPKIASMLGLPAEDSSSSEEDEGDALKDVPEASSRHEREENSHDGDEVCYVEWRECQLCPRKRFLNDAEVEDHLTSKRHVRAVRRMEALSTEEHDHETPPVAQGTISDDNHVPEDIEHPTPAGDLEKDTKSRMTRENGGTPEEPPSTDDEQRQTPRRKDNARHVMTEDQQRRAEKKKAAVKRKLKALKRRKWEKKMKAEKAQESLECTEEPRKGDSLDDGKEMGLQPMQQVRTKKPHESKQTSRNRLD